MIGSADVARAAAALLAAPARRTRPAGPRPSFHVHRTIGAVLAPTPIEPAWIIEAEAGEPPVTEAATLAANEAETLAVYLWQTTRCRYRWEHASDEVVTVLEGEAFLGDDGEPGGERRLGVGDVAFFPAGSRSVWRVPSRLRKVSTLARPLPRPAARLWRWLRIARRRAGDARRMLRRLPASTGELAT